MIPRDVFYTRLEQHCKICPDWDGVCLRGHDLQSPNGCPLRRFEPISGAVFDQDHGLVVQPARKGGCAGCGAPVDASRLRPLTWDEVLVEFGEAMAQWKAAGLPISTPQEHDTRKKICQSCDQFTGYRCLVCHCNILVKAKLKTSYCPLGKW